MPGQDCYECHCPSANHVERKLKMLVLHLVRQGPEQEYQSCFVNVTNQGQNTPATQATLIYNVQNTKQLRLLKIWNTNVDVFKTELTYSPGPCVIPWAFHEHFSFLEEI